MSKLCRCSRLVACRFQQFSGEPARWIDQLLNGPCHIYIYIHIFAYFVERALPFLQSTCIHTQNLLSDLHLNIYLKVGLCCTYRAHLFLYRVPRAALTRYPYHVPLGSVRIPLQICPSPRPSLSFESHSATDFIVACTEPLYGLEQVMTCMVDMHGGPTQGL